MNIKEKIVEFVEQFRLIGAGYQAIVDALVPPLIFIISERFFRLEVALFITLIPSILILVLRILRHQSLLYIGLGTGGLFFAFGSAWISGNAAGYFLPSILSDAVLLILCIVSVFIKRPLVALTSHITRRWPLHWYWQEKIRPAYSEVTLFWGFYFGLKIIPQWILFNRGETQILGWLNILTGLPGTIILLIFSYLYGLRRLRRLKGPSVAEFEEEIAGPWQGQKTGF